MKTAFAIYGALTLAYQIFRFIRNRIEEERMSRMLMKKYALREKDTQ